MAANVTCTITGTLINGSSAAVGSAVVKAVRVAPDTRLAGTMNTDDTLEATSNALTGIFSLALTAYDLLPVTYKITFPDGQYAYLTLPANAKAAGLGKIQVSTSPSKSVKDISARFNPIRFIGQDLASAAALPEPTCDVHTVTGAVAITSITATNFPVGKMLTLNFASTPTFTDGNNLKIAGNLVATADDTITLYYDGTNFYEMSRAVN